MKQKIIISILILLLIVLLVLLCKSCQTPPQTADSALEVDPAAQSWQGYQQTYRASSGKGIAIPGFQKLTFLADSTAQSVNFYNPQTNDCLFVFLLYADDALLWQSGYCPPGNGYYNIEISEPLRNGEYNGILEIQCFRPSGEQLNGARVEFDLIVEE